MHSGGQTNDLSDLSDMLFAFICTVSAVTIFFFFNKIVFQPISKLVYRGIDIGPRIVS